MISKLNRIYKVKNKLAKSFSIFLDDTRRKAEKEIIEKWNTSIKGELRFEKMYATITVGQQFSTKPLSH